MNKRVKKLWVDALRSGEYKQGTGKLKTDDGRFCCLGVLCDLHSKSRSKTKTEWLGNWYKDSEHVLSKIVSDWAGLPAQVDVFVNKQSLANLNDSGSYSFKKIANLIEKYL